MATIDDRKKKRNKAKRKNASKKRRKRTSIVDPVMADTFESFSASSVPIPIRKERKTIFIQPSARKSEIRRSASSASEEDKSRALVNKNMENQIIIREQSAIQKEYIASTQIALLRYRQWFALYVTGCEEWTATLNMIDEVDPLKASMTYPITTICKVPPNCKLPPTIDTCKSMGLKTKQCPFFPFMIIIEKTEWLLPWSYFANYSAKGKDKITMFHRIFSAKDRSDNSELVKRKRIEWKSTIAVETCYPRIVFSIEDIIRRNVLEEDDRGVQVIHKLMHNEKQVRRRNDMYTLAAAMDYIARCLFSKMIGEKAPHLPEAKPLRYADFLAKLFEI